MLTTTISDFRKDIKTYFDEVTNNFETLIINRGKDTGIVIISLDEYSAIQKQLSSIKKNISNEIDISDLKGKIKFREDYNYKEMRKN